MSIFCFIIYLNSIYFKIVPFVSVLNQSENGPKVTPAAGIRLRSQRCLMSSYLLKNSTFFHNQKDMENKQLDSNVELNNDYYKHVRGSLKKVQSNIFEPEFQRVDLFKVSNLQDRNVKEITSEKKSDRDGSNHITDNSGQFTITNFQPSRGLKLTLRVKRHSSSDKTSESDTNVIDDYLEPEYEVLKVEGIDDSSNITYSKRKRRHHLVKRKEKRLYQRRLRLILSNESKTIHFESTLPTQFD